MRRKKITKTQTQENLEKIFNLIGKLLVAAFCITVIYVSLNY